MAQKQRVLFICVHNSGRSQIAEALLRQLAGDRFSVESAGLEPTAVLPEVVEVLKEAGIDISGKKSNNVFDFFKEGRLYNHVITVCDESADAKCPLFPGITSRHHWPFEDPQSLAGGAEDKMVQLREIRDRIKAKIEAWVAEMKEG